MIFPKSIAPGLAPRRLFPWPERRAGWRAVGLAQEALLPTLKNPRHERFAQGLAKGLTQLQAYAEAGYPNPRHAYRLMKRRGVRGRVAELMAGAAERAEIDVAMATEALVRLAGKAEAEGAAPDLDAAGAAWMAAARLNGLTPGQDG